jgi:hypothetical protein
MAEKNVKKRNWGMILYPESAPENWRELLQQTGLPIAISPLHDKDINPTGEPKKAHYHIILCYPGPQTFNAVKTLCEGLNQPIPQALDSVRGNYRYFTHMDNPEKYQYDAAAITVLNGFSIMDFVELTKSEVLRIKQELQGFIRSENIVEYADLMDSLQDGSNTDYYDVASCNTYFFEKYITSRRNKQKNALVRSDPL